MPLRKVRPCELCPLVMGLLLYCMHLAVAFQMSHN